MTLDDLSLLAKRVIEKSVALNENVNRVTDRLSQKNPQVVTLSTLREMLKSFATDEQIDSSELEGLAVVAAQFYDMLASIRTELGKVAQAERKIIREKSLVDSGVMMHGYAALMKEFNEEQAKQGRAATSTEWQRRLQVLSPAKRYTYGAWAGDVFDKRNPLWRNIGVVKPGKDDRIAILNTGGARAECGRALRQLVAAGPNVEALEFLAKQ